jgi:hypothetical protein
MVLGIYRAWVFKKVCMGKQPGASHLAPKSRVSARSHLLMPTDRIISAGFGLGALNDADEDDIDVYDTGSTRGRTHMAYDTADRDDNEDIILGNKQQNRRTGSEKVSVVHNTWLIRPDCM